MREAGEVILYVWECQVRIIAVRIRKSGRIFHWMGRFGWSDGVSNDQLRMAPRVKALIVRRTIGSEQSISESLQ